MKQIINCETGEVIERELNAEEIAQQEKDEAKYLKLKAEEEKQEEKRQKILNKLGITQEEAQLLLGGK